MRGRPGCLQPLERHQRQTQDAVIGCLRMRDVHTRDSGHVTRGAIRLIDVMLSGECIAVAGEAFATIVGDALLWLRR